jgi:hypothetical protein
MISFWRKASYLFKKRRGESPLIRARGRVVFVDLQQIGEDEYALIESTNIVLTKLLWKRRAIDKFMKRNPEALITIYYPHQSEDSDAS